MKPFPLRRYPAPANSASAPFKFSRRFIESFIMTVFSVVITVATASFVPIYKYGVEARTVIPAMLSWAFVLVVIMVVLYWNSKR